MKTNKVILFQYHQCFLLKYSMLCHSETKQNTIKNAKHCNLIGLSSYGVTQNINQLNDVTLSLFYPPTILKAILEFRLCKTLQ